MFPLDRAQLTKADRWGLADWLAEKRLPQVNEKSKRVVPSRTVYARFWKRGIDIAVSGVALIVTLPINAVVRS